MVKDVQTVKCSSHSWKTVGVSYKTAHAIATQPSNCSHRHLSQKNENVYSHKVLCINVHRGFIIIAKYYKQYKGLLTVE